jgi:hypothetical protein
VLAGEQGRRQSDLSRQDACFVGPRPRMQLMVDFHVSGFRRMLGGHPQFLAGKGVTDDDAENHLYQ